MRERILLPGCILLLATLMLSCNRGGGLMGGSSATGDSSGQATQKQGGSKPKAGGQTDPPVTVPQDSVSGQPSTASDNGSAGAVAHRSVAQPGAPEGTVPQGSTKATPAAPPPPPQK